MVNINIKEPNTVIAYVNITTPESELMERIEITEEEWKSPLPRSIFWMQIKEAIDHIQKHRSETAQPQTLKEDSNDDK